MLSLVAWKFEAVKTKPFHYYCTSCKTSAKVVSALGSELSSVTWLKKRNHPCKVDAWDEPSNKFHALRVIYPEMIYSVWKDIATKPCPNCQAIGHMSPSYHSPFDPALVKQSFEKLNDTTPLGEIPLNPKITATCYKCKKDIELADGTKIPMLGGKHYCISCFVTIE